MKKLIMLTVLVIGLMGTSFAQSKYDNPELLKKGSFFSMNDFKNSALGKVEPMLQLPKDLLKNDKNGAFKEAKVYKFVRNESKEIIYLFEFETEEQAVAKLKIGGGGDYPIIVSSYPECTFNGRNCADAYLGFSSFVVIRDVK
jgi:hypothetical protein